MVTESSRRPTRSAAEAAPKRNYLAEISREAKARPSVVVAYGPPGIGKTSLGAAMPSPVFLIDSREDGINTLKTSGLIKAEIPILPVAKTWEDVLGTIKALATEEHDFKTLVIDTLGGMESLCHEFVCRTEFKGKWGEKGFQGYMRGYDVSLPHWREFMNALDRLRNDRGVMIVGMAHSYVKSFNNPEGENYDRYKPHMHEKTWNITHRWSDMVLFINYRVEVVSEGTSKPKGRGGSQRVMCTENDAAFDAKNRHNLPQEIEMGDSGTEAWANLRTAITESRKTGA